MKSFNARQLALLPLMCAVWLQAAAAEAPGAATAATPPTPSIAGVVTGGTPVELVKDGFEAVEGPLRDTDGGLLFTNNQAGRILRIAPDGTLSTWLEAPLAANALTRTPRGEVVATLQKTLAIGVVQAGSVEARILAGQYDGKPFNRPNDLVADSRGNIYFTDTVAIGFTGTPAIPSALYRIGADGRLARITTDIPRPNGVALSPDERTLYVANTSGEWVLAYALDAGGAPGAQREFAKLALPTVAPGAAAPNGAGADGLAVDRDGRVYVATAAGVQVFSPRGEALGIIRMPRQPQNLAFAGADRSTLYVVGRGSVYRIATLTRGPDRPGK
jgi:gluconolactonase